MATPQVLSEKTGAEISKALKSLAGHLEKQIIESQNLPKPKSIPKPKDNHKETATKYREDKKMSREQREKQRKRDEKIAQKELYYWKKKTDENVKLLGKIAHTEFGRFVIRSYGYVKGNSVKFFQSLQGIASGMFNKIFGDILNQLGPVVDLFKATASLVNDFVITPLKSLPKLIIQGLASVTKGMFSQTWGIIKWIWRDKTAEKDLKESEDQTNFLGKIYKMATQIEKLRKLKEEKEKKEKEKKEKEEKEKKKEKEEGIGIWKTIKSVFNVSKSTTSSIFSVIKFFLPSVFMTLATAAIPLLITYIGYRYIKGWWSKFKYTEEGQWIDKNIVTPITDFWKKTLKPAIIDLWNEDIFPLMKNSFLKVGGWILEGIGDILSPGTAKKKDEIYQEQLNVKNKTRQIESLRNNEPKTEEDLKVIEDLIKEIREHNENIKKLSDEIEGIKNKPIEITISNSTPGFYNPVQKKTGGLVPSVLERGETFYTPKDLKRMGVKGYKYGTGYVEGDNNIPITIYDKPPGSEDRRSAAGVYTGRFFKNLIKDFFKSPAEKLYGEGSPIREKQLLNQQFASAKSNRHNTAPPISPTSSKEYSSDEIIKKLQDAFGSEWETAAKIVLAESGGWTDAHRGIGQNTGDFGLFQINYKHLPDLKHLGINSVKDLYDPDKNIAAAKFLYNRSHGWNDWNNSKYQKGGGGWMQRGLDPKTLKWKSGWSPSKGSTSPFVPGSGENAPSGIMAGLKSLLGSMWDISKMVLSIAWDVGKELFTEIMGISPEEMMGGISNENRVPTAEKQGAASVGETQASKKSFYDSLQEARGREQNNSVGTIGTGSLGTGSLGSMTDKTGIDNDDLKLYYLNLN